MIHIPIEIIVLGFTAQFFFSARVIIQWFYSEREAKVITPTIYWILSLSASLLFFMYGYFRDDFAIKIIILILAILLSIIAVSRALHSRDLWRPIAEKYHKDLED